ncbi:MAG: hypothetical protein AB7E95_09295 [Kiritimatiellales bacterium]
MKRLMRKTKGLIRGVPSAVLLSAAIHFLLLFIAGSFVVFSVMKREEKKFVPPKPIERPKMDLKKPRVKVRKSARPRSTQRIVARGVQQSMPDIQLPEVSGMNSGLIRGVGGFEMMPDASEISMFGGRESVSIGNDFEGTFYAFELDRQGRKNGISDEQYLKVIRRFLDNDWNPNVFSFYYRSPQKLYTTQIMIPPISSEFGPSQFGMGFGADFDPIHWLVHYKGNIASKTGGRFRFRGMGDDILVVRIGKTLVLNASWNTDREAISDWRPSSDEDRKYLFGHAVAGVGDWFELEPEVPVSMEIIIGEKPGGLYAAMLVVEQDGVEYPVNQDGMPILPAFKTAEIPQSVIEEIQYTLIDGEVDLFNDLMFNVY